VLNGEKPTNESLSAERKSGTGKVKPEDAKGQSRSHSREKEKDWKNGKETEERRAEEKGGGKKERRKERAGDKDGQRNRDREKSKNKVKKNDQELANGLVPNGDVIMNGPVGSESQEPQQRIPRPTSAKGSRTRTTANDSDGDGEGGVIQESGENIAVPEAVAANHVTDERPVGRATSGVRRRPTQQTQEAEGQVTASAQVAAAEEETSDPPIAVQRPARPSSARPAPPRVKRTDAREDPDVRLGSGKEKTATAPVIVEDHGHDDEEEEDAFIVEEIQQPDVVLVRFSVCLFICLPACLLAFCLWMFSLQTAVGHQSTGQEVTPGALVKTLEATQKKLVAASEQNEVMKLSHTL
jgi:TRAF3-interacting protein 1